MNRTKEARLSSFYMHVLEYFENRGDGENTITTLLAECVELDQDVYHTSLSLLRRARYFVMGEREGIAQKWSGFPKAIEQFEQKLEEKVLSLQGER